MYPSFDQWNQDQSNTAKEIDESGEVLRLMRSITYSRQAVDTRHLNSALAILLGGRERAIHRLGGPVTLYSQADDRMTSITVTENRDEDGILLGVQIPSDDYQAIILPLEDEERSNPFTRAAPTIMGRYLRISAALDFLLTKKELIDYSNDIFKDKVQISGNDVHMDAESEEAQRVAATRLAGGLAIRSTPDIQQHEVEIRDYLQFFLNDRVSYIQKHIEFANKYNLPMVSDIGSNIDFWKGVCLPLKIPDLGMNLWNIQKNDVEN